MCAEELNEAAAAEAAQEQQKQDDIFTQRLAKKQELEEAGIKPYGIKVEGLLPSAEVLSKYRRRNRNATASVSTSVR